MKLRFWLAGFVGLIFLGVLTVAGVAAYFFVHYGKDLPSVESLAEYKPATVTRVHASDGRLLAEYAIENRVFVPIESIPGRIINAFLSAEDKSFYEHPGVDIQSIIGAVITNLKNYSQGRRLVGASTITQQVAKNFLLTNEVSIERKIKEAILALRIEKAISKDEILELYFNEIYLGLGSYGVTSAALNYFNKSLDELTVAEAAYLAALPKAPSNYHPNREKEAAIDRRNWVIGQMEDNGYITPQEADAARAEDLVVREREEAEVARADYFTEEVRREIQDLYGDDALYKGGLSVRTTVEPDFQAVVDQALRDGLMAYDQRHGWRGPIGALDLEGENVMAQLASFQKPMAALDHWQVALVRELSGEAAAITLQNGGEGTIPFAEMSWARPWLEGQRVGAEPSSPNDVLNPGDLVLVEAKTEGAEGEALPEGIYSLRQIPDISGAVIALDPHTGRVLALSGGFNFAESEFNRATQANRQPGSAIKPFVYLSALENGFTPASIINDAPFVISQGAGLEKWSPSNYSNEFYGPTPLRIGVEKSRNLMTVRLAANVTPEVVAEYVEAFGIMDDMPPLLSMALGAGETTPLRLATAYGMLANGGKRITPTLIDRVQDREGLTIFRHDNRACDACQDVDWSGQAMPRLPDDRERVATEAGTYQIINILTGAIQSGTGVRLRGLNMTLGGKTGTTNDSQDAWFMAVMPNLVVGVYTGFDTPKPLGPREAGSTVALPIFKLIAERALADKPQAPFRVPPGVSLVWVDHQTGLRAQPGQEDVVLEAFLPGTEPEVGQTSTGDALDYSAGTLTDGGLPTTTIDGSGGAVEGGPTGLGTQVGEGQAGGQQNQQPTGSATSGGLY